MKKQVVPSRPGGSSCLSESLDYAAQTLGKVRFFDHNAVVVSECTFEEVRIRALKHAQYLLSLDFPRGSYVALIAETRLEFIILFYACQYAGLIPSALPFTVRPTGREVYEKKLLRFLDILKPVLLIAPESIDPIVQSIGQNMRQSHQVQVATYEQIAVHANTQTPLADHQQTSLKPHEDAFVQYSSGSTSEPAGLVATQHAVMENLDAINIPGLDIGPNEQYFSWLPFDHDMGLVGLVISAVNTQSSTDYISPQTFMAKPQLWLELMSSCRSTLCFAPAFAYELALQKRDHDKPLDLSALRIAGVGGDMIHAQTLHTFAQEMKHTGFRFESFHPAYGLAEMILGVTLSVPGEGPYIHTFSNEHFSQELVSCGRVLPGFDITIKHESIPISSLHSAGEVWVKGPSLVTQSLNAAEKIRQDENGFIFTGDLGFFHEGYLFIAGRSKDMIIIRGRNIWAQDVEQVATGCDNRLDSHSVAAIGITQNRQEHLVILVQNNHFSPDERKTLQQNILTAINQTFGVKAQFIWTQPNQLSTTTLGKLARAQIKLNYLNNTLLTITQ